MNLTRLKMLYASGRVKRLHVVDTLLAHPISSHVYGSQLIAVELCSAENLPADAMYRILVTLLYHDAPEIATGDTPAPVKRQIPGLNAALEKLESIFYEQHSMIMPELTQIEKKIVLASDCGDLAFSCLRERQMGNHAPELADVDRGELGTSVGGVFRKVVEYMNDIGLASVTKLTHHLEAEWRRAEGRLHHG